MKNNQAIKDFHALVNGINISSLAMMAVTEDMINVSDNQLFNLKILNIQDDYDLGYNETSLLICHMDNMDTSELSGIFNMSDSRSKVEFLKRHYYVSEYC